LIGALVAVWFFTSVVGFSVLLVVYPAAKRATWTYCVILLLAFGSYFTSTWALSNEITHGTVSISTIQTHGAPK
jgi:uncharacterized membrane protein